MVAEAPRLTTTRLARTRSRCRAELLGRRRRCARPRIRAELTIGYDRALGEGISRDPIGEKGGRQLYEFLGNSAVALIDPVGLASEPVIIRGPTATINAWIAFFDPMQMDKIAFAKAYVNLTGDVSIFGDLNNFWQRVLAGIMALAGSFNPIPGSTFDPLSQEMRGWLSLPVTISCDCHGHVKQYATAPTASNGFTPAPIGPPLADEGSGPSTSCSGVGTGFLYCTSFAHSRVGPLGQEVARALFPAGGVPYRWGRIEYVLRCDRTYEIRYATSYFPSHKAYRDGVKVGMSNQRGLADFMFSGDGRDAPGGEFHVERGYVE